MFGVGGVVFHICALNIHGGYLIILMSLTLGGASLFLGIVVDNAVSGTDAGRLYWLATPIAEVIALTIVILLVLSRPKENKWAKRLGISVIVDCQIKNYNVARMPPYFMLVIANISHLHEARFIQVQGHLLDMFEGAEGTPAADSGQDVTASALIMDPTQEQIPVLAADEKVLSQRIVHNLPAQDLVSRIGQEGANVLWIRRIHEKDGGYDSLARELITL